MTTMTALTAVCRALLRTRWMPERVADRWRSCLDERDVLARIGEREGSALHPLTAGHLLGWRALPDSWFASNDWLRW